MPKIDSSIPRIPGEASLVEPEQGVVQAQRGSQGQWSGRWLGLLVGLLCLGILVAAWHLTDRWLPFGPGTQISLPGCALRERTGYPCPTCGMTRAWAHAVRAELGMAFRANIGGALFALVCPIIGWGGLGTAIGGWSFYRRFVQPVVRLLKVRQWIYAALGLIGLGWAWNAIRAWATIHEFLR